LSPLTLGPSAPYKNSMFGFSLQKLLFTGLVIAAIFYGFRWFTQMQERRDQNLRRRGNGGKPQSSAKAGNAKAADADIETMVECKVCGSFVASGGARSCGREDCPYPG
jgi:hypothetical protein